MYSHALINLRRKRSVRVLKDSLLIQKNLYICILYKCKTPQNIHKPSPASAVIIAYAE